MEKINFKNFKFNEKIIIKTLVFLLFLTISLLILKEVFLTDGLILGGDWSVPSGHSQMDRFIENYGNTWATSNNFLGNKTMATNIVPFLAITKAFSLLGLSGPIFSKLLLLFIFTFAGFFIYLLLKSLRLMEFPAIVGGVIYMTTPLFFNYTIMGWFYILLFVMTLLPLAVKYFIKAIEEDKIKFAIIAGGIYALAFIQAQAAVWFMVVFLALAIYLITDKKSFLVYLKTLMVMVASLLLFNSYWLIESLVSLDKGIIGSDIVNSGPSLGMLTHFSPINIIRLFSSLYNFQYETIINNSNFPFLSFFLPVLVFCSLFIKKNKKLILSFWLIGLIPITMYILNFNRDILLKIPFSNVIRDFPRFTVLSTFAYAILASFWLNFLLSDKKKILKYFGFVLIIICFLSIFPWWTGELTNWQASSGPDIRIRLKVFPDEYLKLEKYFSEKKMDQKAFYLPTSGIVGFEDDIKFRGAYHETSDVTAGFSSIPGALSLTDRSMGSVKEYISVINGEFSSNLVEALSSTNVKYFVIRKNMTLDDKDKIINSFDNKIKNGQINKFFSGEKVLVYSRNNFLPHFYSPKSIIIFTNSIERFGDIVSQKKYNIRSAIYFNNQTNIITNSSSTSAKPIFNSSELKKEVINNTPVIEFKKINLTKYRVIIHNAKDNFPLVFSESFHDDWKSYLVDYQKSALNFNGSDYKILDGNTDDQANAGELRSFVDQGYISSLGSLKAKNIKHFKWVDNREVFDYNEKYKIDFISKNFQDTIQNDNLENGNFYETWFKKPIDDNKNHLMVNGYANSWNINPNEVCLNNAKCVKNADGSYDLELVIEFWPQRLFYIGLFISGTTLLGCLGYLGWDLVKRKKKKTVKSLEKID